MDDRKVSLELKAQGEVLQTFSRTLTREMSVLTQHPNLFWQQMHNRLQWEENVSEQLLAPEVTKRVKLSVKPWLRMKTPYSESRSLIASFSKAGNEKSAAFSQDGRLLFCWETIDRRAYHRAFNVVSGAEVNLPDNPKIAPRSGAWGGWPGKTFTSRDDHQFEIIVTDTTPKSLVNFIEGKLKISYHNFPNRISFEFRNKQQDQKLNSANIWSIHVIPDGRRFNDDVRTCAFSPDGRYAATCLLSRHKSVHIWNMKTGKLKRRLRNRNYSVTACGFSPDGKRIITAGFDEDESAWVLRVWNIRNGRCTQEFRGHRGNYQAHVTFCEYSPDGTIIASGGKDQPLLLWDASNKTASRSQPTHTAQTSGCCFSKDGQWVVSAGGSKVIIQNPEDGALLQQWTHPQKPGKKLLQDCSVSSDRRWIATSVEVSKPLNPYETWTHICLWDTGRGRRAHKIKSSEKLPITHTSYSRPEKPTRHIIKYCGEFSPKDSTFISVGFGNYSDNVVVWEANSGQPLRTLEGFVSGTEAVRYSPDGAWIGVASNEPIKNKSYAYIGELGIYEAESGKKSTTLKFEEGKITCFGFNPDGDRIVSGGENGEVLLWNRDKETPLLKIPAHQGTIRFCDFIQKGEFIISVGEDQWIRVWNLTGTLVTSLPFPQDIMSGNVHPNQSALAFGDSAGYVHLFKLIGEGNEALV